MLAVLDNCEHVGLTPAARMVEALLRVNPVARVITTSRDPLRAEGEQIFRVPPLEQSRRRSCARTSENFAALWRNSALFVERAAGRRAALLAGRVGRGRDLPASRRQPAFAIELAAARVATLSVAEIASRLDDHFDLLSGGYRTVLPRQRTLRASFDCRLSAYSLEIDKRVLRSPTPSSLAVSTAASSHGRVAASTNSSWADIIDCIANLVEKSLIAADVGASGSCTIGCPRRRVDIRARETQREQRK